MMDPLTGVPNIVGLLDWMNGLACQKHLIPFSLAAFHLTALWQVNRGEGREAGDDLLKHSAQILSQQQPGRVFRAGGDKFVVYLGGPDHSAHAHLTQHLAEAIHPGRVDPALRPPRAAAIHFTEEKECTPGHVLACLFVALADQFHEGLMGQVVEFEAGRISELQQYPWMMVDLADQLLRLGSTADRFQALAQTDCISQLPNTRAAMEEIEAGLAAAGAQGEPYSILLIDGDNLRRFNSVSYEAGDEAIRLMGAALKQQLREIDFLARFRSGDEFLVLLRDSTREQALYIAQRLCWAVERASRAWLFPTTISIGVAVFPEQGTTVQELLHTAESGLDLAKKQGKNRVVSGLSLFFQPIDAQRPDIILREHRQ